MHRAPIVALLAGLAASVALAGPLDPPSGPVAPTMKTLTEVEPRIAINAANTPGNAAALYVISQPGSYYLTGNVTGVAGKTSVLASCGGRVTIDLNGFQITGGTIGVDVECQTYAVRNGSISGCSDRGVLRSGNGPSWGTVEDVAVYACAGNGFELSYESVLRRCRAYSNGQDGFCVYGASILEQCSATYNGSHGFDLRGDDATASDCVASSNTANGFQVGAPQFGTGKSTLRSCRASFNSHNGFEGEQTTFEGCDARRNAHFGFELGSASSMRRCKAKQNQAQGVHGMDSNTVVSCEVRDHPAGFSGIWLEGSFNTVEDTESSGNGFGFFFNATGTQNIVVRCRATANPGGNYTIPPGNQAAPVVTNPGANGYATMTAWSNISY